MRTKVQELIRIAGSPTRNQRFITATLETGPPRLTQVATITDPDIQSHVIWKQKDVNVNADVLKHLVADAVRKIDNRHAPIEGRYDPNKPPPPPLSFDPDVKHRRHVW
jgi:hypothetical protein